jgi:hypothetical protein
MSLFLYMIAKIRPEAWDAIIPHSPRVSQASREYMTAMALKGFAAELGKGATAQKLTGIQKALVTSAASQLVADYDDDNWCKTPYPHRFTGLDPEPAPWFSPFSDVMLNPQPLPPKELQKEIAGYLLLLSEATSVESAAKDLKSLGGSLLGGGAKQAGVAARG